MSVQNYCTDLPGGFYNDNCPDEKGGIIAVAYIHSSVYPMADPTDGSEWQTDITAGDTKSVLFTRGEYPGIEWQTEEGYGETDEEVTGGMHTVTYSHKNVNEIVGGTPVNIDFYDKLANAPGQYYFAWVTGDYQVRISTAPVTVKPKHVDPQSRKEKQRFDVEVVWSDNHFPDTYDPAPTYIYQGS